MIRCLLIVVYVLLFNNAESRPRTLGDRIIEIDLIEGLIDAQFAKIEFNKILNIFYEKYRLKNEDNDRIVFDVNHYLIENGFNILNTRQMSFDNMLPVSSALREKIVDCDVLSIIYYSIFQSLGRDVDLYTHESTTFHVLIGFNRVNGDRKLFETTLGKFVQEETLRCDFCVLRKINKDELIGLYYGMLAQYFRLVENDLTTAYRLINNALNHTRTFSFNYGILAEIIADKEGAMKSIPIYWKALKVNPKDIICMYNLGYTYFELNMNDSAKYHYEKTISYYPDYIYARIGLSKVSMAIGDTDVAIFHLRHILTLDGNHATANYLLGVVHIFLGQCDIGTRFIKKALSVTDDEYITTNSSQLLLKCK